MRAAISLALLTLALTVGSIPAHTAAQARMA